MALLSESDGFISVGRNPTLPDPADPIPCGALQRRRLYAVTQFWKFAQTSAIRTGQDMLSARGRGGLSGQGCPRCHTRLPLYSNNKPAPGFKGFHGS